MGKEKGCLPQWQAALFRLLTRRKKNQLQTVRQSHCLQLITTQWHRLPSALASSAYLTLMRQMVLSSSPSLESLIIFI